MTVGLLPTRCSTTPVSLCSPGGEPRPERHQRREAGGVGEPRFRRRHRHQARVLGGPIHPHGIALSITRQFDRREQARSTGTWVPAMRNIKLVIEYDGSAYAGYNARRSIRRSRPPSRTPWQRFRVNPLRYRRGPYRRRGARQGTGREFPLHFPMEAAWIARG